MREDDDNPTEPGDEEDPRGHEGSSPRDVGRGSRGLLEDLRELSKQIKKEIERAVREIKAGKFPTHDQLKAELGFW